MDQIRLVEMGGGRGVGEGQRNGNDHSNRMEIVVFLIDSKRSFKGNFYKGWMVEDD